MPPMKKRTRYDCRFYFSTKRPYSSIAMEEDHHHHDDRDSNSIQNWSLQRLADTNQADDRQQMATLVKHIALRLDRQQSLIFELQTLVQQVGKDRQIVTSKAPSPKKVISATNRPYWWTFEQEQHLDQELMEQQKNLHNLKVLHNDTHQQCTAMHQQLLTGNSKMLPQLLEKTFAEVYARHSLTVETMAELVIGLRPLVQPPKLKETVMDFLKSRMTLQLLCDHIVQLLKNRKNHGAISVDTSISQIVQEAVTETNHLCDAHFQTSPPVQVLTGSDIKATLVRPWLQYTLVELLKNSMTVTVEGNRNQCQCLLKDNSRNDDNEEDIALCPIFIQIQETPEQVIIRILDQGGGCEKDETQLFDFASCREKWDRLDDQQTYAMPRSPLRGLGVGLSLSQLMMHQFGGSLQLQNRPMSDLEPGMTATIVLPKDTNIPESLPHTD